MIPEIVRINKKSVDLIEKYYDFLEKIFPSAKFREWYERGFWTDTYTPYSIIKDDIIISNVSASRMNLIVGSKNKSGIQFGAVGTIPEYRNRGLSRHLMNHVISEFKGKIDLFFLFANEDVLDFYPKFGFNRFQQFVFSLETNLPVSGFKAKKLNLNNTSDYKLLNDLVENGKEITIRFGARNYYQTTFWHILNLYRNDLYFLEDINTLFIMREIENKLHIFEIYYQTAFDIKSALSDIILSDQIKSILFYFPPDQLKFNYNKVIKYEDAPLFVLGEFKPGTDKIKFPETAMT